MNHMELQQELAKHESNPSGMKKTQQLQDEKLAITQELEVSNVTRFSIQIITFATNIQIL